MPLVQGLCHSRSPVPSSLSSCSCFGICQRLCVAGFQQGNSAQLQTQLLTSLGWFWLRLTFLLDLGPKGLGCPFRLQQVSASFPAEAGRMAAGMMMRRRDFTCRRAWLRARCGPGCSLVKCK